jgi:hypothetical protein
MWKAKAVLSNHDVVNLNSRPITGDIHNAASKADDLARDLANIEEFQYCKFTCITCEHCEFDKWVPHHPLFKCKIGGEMDPRSTTVVKCPEADRD